MWDFQLEIPPLIAAACAGLAILASVFLVRMLAEGRRVLREIGVLRGIVKKFHPLTPETRHQGLALQHLETVRGAVRNSPPAVRRLWNDVELALEPYRGSGGSEGWFATRPTNELFSEAAIIDRRYHTSLHQTVPSILTALGLMTTFVAILLALEGVNVEVKGGAEIVQGIGTLINGLAGKFLSSIVALFFAVAFTLAEKAVERRLQSSYDNLLSEAREAIPVLSQFRVLLDMHELAARRTGMLDRFYGEMAKRVVGVAQTQIVPALSGMLADDLTEAVEARLAPALDEIRARAKELERVTASIERGKVAPKKA